MSPSRFLARPSRCSFAALAGVFVSGPALAFGVGGEAWVAQYNGQFSYWEEVTDLAAGDGCVYVTGFEYTDYVTRAFATVKYDDGHQLWVRTYGLGGTNGSAQANAVAVDQAGNVFVTGWSYEYIPGPPFERIINDAATLKYDSEGNLLWQRRYRLPGENNQPQDVVIDSAGNAYVAGAAWVGEGFDLMLLKYSSEGVLLWDRTIGKSGDRWDAGFAVALDPDENPVVAGYTEPFFFNPTTYGYLVKYSASGNLLWQRDHVSYSNGHGWWRVVINPAGRIYTFGEIAPPGELSHLWTSQYDSNGTLLWDRHYDGTANESNFAGGMALTPTGGVVVNGTSWDFNENGGLTQIATIRYDPDGTEVWRRLDRGGYAHAVGRDVAVDTSGAGGGRAYVTGYGFNDNGFEDMVTLCYTAEGDLAWTEIYADPNGRSDRATAIAVDGADGEVNVYVAGDAWVGFESYYDFTTIRYADEGRAAELVDFQVAFGSLISGGLQDLRASDDARVRARSQAGFLASEANVVDLRVGAVTGVEGPTLMDLAVEGRISQSGGTARLRVRNWSTNSFQLVHQYAVGSTETVEVVDDIDAADRVRQSDGRIELSIRQSVVATFSAMGFDSLTDQVRIVVE